MRGYIREGVSSPFYAPLAWGTELWHLATDTIHQKLPPPRLGVAVSGRAKIFSFVSLQHILLANTERMDEGCWLPCHQRSGKKNLHPPAWLVQVYSVIRLLSKLITNSNLMPWVTPVLLQNYVYRPALCPVYRNLCEVIGEWLARWRSLPPSKAFYVIKWAISHNTWRRAGPTSILNIGVVHYSAH